MAGELLLFGFEGSIGMPGHQRNVFVIKRCGGDMMDGVK